ncbi:MAG: thioester domain-containing protein [Chloroflexota bacterium]|nr:thioester domain-containing protein [Chloroflexota bacterium]
MRFALLACTLFLAFAGKANAATVTPNWPFPTTGGTVTGTYKGMADTAFATPIQVTLDDGQVTWAYCIDYETPLQFNVPHDENEWSEANVPNLGKIARILRMHPADATVALGNVVEAQAVQSAIWHFSDGFDLTGGADGVVELYNSIVADANANPVPEPGDSLSLSAPADATAGDAVPVTVRSTAASVSFSLSPSDGADLTTCEEPYAAVASSVSGPFPRTVCVRRTTAGGPVELSATANAPVPTGRVFIYPGSQKIILAAARPVPMDTSVSLSWAPVADACPNLGGYQASVPEDMVKNADGDCVPPEDSDVCPNLAGPQPSVPNGMVKDSDGACVSGTSTQGGSNPPPPPPPPSNPTFVCVDEPL